MEKNGEKKKKLSEKSENEINENLKKIRKKL